MHACAAVAACSCPADNSAHTLLLLLPDSSVHTLLLLLPYCCAPGRICIMHCADSTLRNDAVPVRQHDTSRAA
jgi:hypothetical protein